MKSSLITRLLALTLAATLGGAPQLLAQEPAPQPQPNITADPAQGPVEPAPSTQTPEEQESTLPDAPSAAQPAATQQPSPGNQPAESSSKPPQEPAGTAAAGRASTVGGAASKPAGTAIAPAKQRQVRSLLIKIGAIAAAGAAIGIVYGLSKGTSSRPPGATTTANPAPAP